MSDSPEKLTSDKEDDDELKMAISDAVQKITVKALQDLTLDSMDSEDAAGNTADNPKDKEDREEDQKEDQEKDDEEDKESEIVRNTVQQATHEALLEVAEGSLEEDDDSDKDETAPETSSDDLKNSCTDSKESSDEDDLVNATVEQVTSKAFKEVAENKSLDDASVSENGNDLLQQLQTDLNQVGSETESEDVETNGEEISEADNIQPELVVLDPNHPLMKRFQDALKAHLVKQIERCTLAHREMISEVKRKKREREDLGVQLYGAQQELAKQQADLEEIHEKRSSETDHRREVENLLKQNREDFQKNKEKCDLAVKRNLELQNEVDGLSTKLFHLNNIRTDLRSDISVMKRATERADLDVMHLETFKKRQDLYVDRLQSQVIKLKEDIAMLEAQRAAQAEETAAATKSLNEAAEEVESIKIEKKQIYQQWTSSLVGMRRRDEAHAAMQEALNLARQQVKSLETEIVGYKRSTQKEEEKNEMLTVLLKKSENDCQMTKKSIKTCLSKQDTLKRDYSTYSKTLHETERRCNTFQIEKSTKQSELTVLRQQIEREFIEKIKLEDEILEQMQLQLTSEKAQQYTTRITENLRSRKKQLEIELTSVENEEARSALQHTESKTRVRLLKKQLQELESEIKNKNEMINRIEQDTTKRNILIERKQLSIDKVNRKIAAHISKHGGEEMGPLEIQINHLNKEISSCQNNLIEQQQHWLRQQQNLVKLNCEKDEELVTVDSMKKAESILSQKKLRIENEIEYEEKELNSLNKKQKSLRVAMSKLNSKLTEEKKSSDEIQQGNAVTEKQFAAELKGAEIESMEMQEKLQNLVDEKEKILKDLIEAEREIMLWEKKTQLVRETRAAVDTGVGQSEMRAMKAEIHRMEVRYSQLMKQQELMIREMEQSVTRRDFIAYQGDAKILKSTKSRITRGNFQKKLNEIERKIKNVQKDVMTSDEDIKQLKKSQEDLGRSLEEKQRTVQQLQDQLEDLDDKIQNLLENKQKNLNEIISKQTKVKYLTAAKDGKYNKLCKSEESLEAESEKQENRFHHTMNILDRIGQEFPHARQSLRRVSSTFNTIN